MARLDGTGPTGNGPMTGRGMGNCNPNSSAYVGRGAGIRGGRGGRGMGRGQGMGWRNNIVVLNDKVSLTEEKAELERRLANINKELSDVEK